MQVNTPNVVEPLRLCVACAVLGKHKTETDCAPPQSLAFWELHSFHRSPVRIDTCNLDSWELEGCSWNNEHACLSITTSYTYLVGARYLTFNYTTVVYGTVSHLALLYALCYYATLYYAVFLCTISQYIVLYYRIQSYIQCHTVPYSKD